MNVPDALVDAAWRAPVRAPRGWRWRSGRFWQLLGLLIWVGLGVGFTGGAIGQMAENMGVNATQAAALGVLQAGPLIFAMRWPLLSWRIMAIGMLAGAITVDPHDLVWPWPVTAFLALVAVLLQVAGSYERSTAIGAGLLTALGVMAPMVLLGKAPLWFALILCGILLVAMVLGDALTGRYAAEQRTAEAQARQAVLEERARIARELHDVVAHHMSVIALQSEAAPFKIKDLPPNALGTFEVIRDAAREALSETRRLVGLLRENDETAERRPQPGLALLDDLLDRAEQAGLNVKSQVIGMPRTLHASVDLSAYRIVQEALSNAARYAPGSRVQVEVRYGDETLSVAVVDDGAGGEVVSEPGGGHGLVGMRERVTMLDGTLSTGPAEDGRGFAVAAELPYSE